MTGVLAALRRPAGGGGGGGGGGSPLSAVATGAVWSFVGGSFFFCHSVVGVTGGAAPYGVSWNVLTGDAVCIDPTNTTSSFTSASGGTSTVNCAVTDANGLTGTSNTVSLHL